MVSPVSAVGLAVPPIAPIIVGAELVMLGILVVRRITKGGSKKSSVEQPSPEAPKPAPTDTTATGKIGIPPYFEVEASHKQEHNDVRIKVTHGKRSADIEFKDWVLRDPAAFANIVALITTLLIPGYIPGSPIPKMDPSINKSQLMASAALATDELRTKYNIPVKEARSFAMTAAWVVYRDISGKNRSDRSA